MPEYCEFCDEQIKTMSFLGTGYCSIDCKKGRPHNQSIRQQRQGEK